MPFVILSILVVTLVVIPFYFVSFGHPPMRLFYVVVSRTSQTRNWHLDRTKSATIDIIPFFYNFLSHYQYSKVPSEPNIKRIVPFSTRIIRFVPIFSSFELALHSVRT